MESLIANSDSLIHQIFLLVMGSLYALAMILGISYKAANIYCYFVFFPLSFSLLLKGWKKYLFLPLSLLFLLFPGMEAFSIRFFDLCVDFLNWAAPYLRTDYVGASVYLCVLVPLLGYLGLALLKLNRKQLQYLLAFSLGISGLYMLLVYPNFPSLLEYAMPYLPLTNSQ